MSLPDLPRRALLLDDARPGGASVLFRDPIDWIVATTPDEALAALARIDAAVAGGLWVAGSFAFELGYLLEPKLRPLYRQPGDPLIAIGTYEKRVPVGGAALAAKFSDRPAAALGSAEPSLDFAGYEKRFTRVRDYIAAGDVYQINLTFPLSLPVAGDPLARLVAWRAYARAGHAAILRLDDRDVFSFSPELFLAAEGDGVIRARPMKGTARRAPDANGEADAKAALQTDPKQRAENLMIVDLLRNDLSRVCEAGSVKVTDLFTVETYPTLHTMTSGIEGRLRPGLAPSEILRALFPCGSVTGAPKVRAMEIIAETEASPRGFYCGAIGAFGPGGEIDLNVAIRTLVHEHGAARLRMGVGGGLVYDSKARSEYAECLLKARFAASEPFELLETLRWEPDAGYVFLEEHIGRLARAAAYFLFPYDERVVLAALEDHATHAEPRRVRLRLAATGEALVESAALGEMKGPLRLAVAATRVASDDPFARHKTTRRAVYDAALAEAKALGADEAILLNEHGRVADGSFTTLFVLKDGALLTPPVSEGALDGILKRVLAGRSIVETPLTLNDLRSAEALYAGNSVRGLFLAVLV
ncbi:Isochorismate synthase MenF [Alphaproteobacteria bacterium SO-S41]|nr:Isochorismate synthase MenF [Alphaproteobacteria bacterium SO-S41]